MPDAPTTAIQRCIERLNAADPAARDELLRLTRDRLLAMVRGLITRYPGLRRWEQSDDVLQNVHLRLLRGLDQVPVSSVRDFLGLVATNMRRELTDLTRHHFGDEGGGRHHATPPAAVDGGMPVDMADDRGNPAVLAEWAELHEHVAALPEQEREVVDLHWYHGLTQPEVAKLLGVSLKTVKRQWVAAKARLAARLGRPGPGPV